MYGIYIIKIRPSYLYNGNSYTGKIAFLYWDGPQMMVISYTAYDTYKSLW